jgi:hypothetical protein
MSKPAPAENATMNTLRAELNRLDSQIRQSRQILTNMESTHYNITKHLKIFTEQRSEASNQPNP